MDSNKSEQIHDQVRKAYGQIASSGGSCCGSSGCCDGAANSNVAQAVGYSAEELAQIPDGANMGLSCGNPTALASLRPGEVVLDLGSGGGFDVFIAAAKVGPTGRAIGVDMTAEMLKKARAGIAAFTAQTGLNNVEFRLGEIEHLPVPDNSVDVIISNCVINLSPDKPQVWREIARVLRPGGRVSISDLALQQPLPQELRESVEALVGCIAGAVLVDENRQMAQAAGLAEITIQNKPQYVDSMTQINDPLYAKLKEILPANTKLSDYVTSMDLTARKAKLARCCG